MLFYASIYQQFFNYRYRLYLTQSSLADLECFVIFYYFNFVRSVFLLPDQSLPFHIAIFVGKFAFFVNTFSSGFGPFIQLFCSMCLFSRSLKILCFKSIFSFKKNVSFRNLNDSLIISPTRDLSSMLFDCSSHRSTR
jgi:hypothetical protein